MSNQLLLNNNGKVGDVQLQASSDDLNQLNKILKSVIDSSYDAIFVCDNNAIGLMMNEAYTRMTGVTPDELIGRHMKDLIEEGIISSSATLKVLEEKSSVTIVQSVKGKELLVTGNPVYNEKGEITHVVSNLRDISELNRLRKEIKENRELKERYLNELKRMKQKELEELHLDGVIAQSDEIIEALGLAKKLAKVDTTALLLGESGVGKEVFANIIQSGGPRADKPYIKVNCAAIPEHLLESELFGYEKGAFTGAYELKKGYFEHADGGTIFLDEIGEMSLELQAKLLRVLQNYEIVRVGGTKPIKVDVRVISATNRDLEKMVEEGKFRKDLFYRLNVVPLRIPPLRERKADIPPLAYSFLNKINKRYGMNKRFAVDVIEQFERYDWPGNIREMENLIERLVITSDEEIITLEDLPDKLLGVEDLSRNKSLKDTLEQVERKIIRDAIKKYKTTRKAAEALGVSQSTIVKKMKRLNISFE